jgi:hypothetical protein
VMVVRTGYDLNPSRISSSILITTQAQPEDERVGGRRSKEQATGPGHAALVAVGELDREAAVDLDPAKVTTREDAL